jgi:hypothetical protein
MAIGAPPGYDPYADVEEYRAQPEAVIVDMSNTMFDQATWYRLDRAICAVPGAYPVRKLVWDQDGRMVTHEVGGVCGSEHVLRWLRLMTRLPIQRHHL